MNYYLKNHCYSKKTHLPPEGNLLVMNQEYLFEGETPRSQLWIGLEESAKHMIAIQVEDGSRAKKRKSDFHGLLNLSHLQEQDQGILEMAKEKLTQEDYRFWEAEPLTEERYSRYRSLTKIKNIILAIHLTEAFTYEYSIWIETNEGKSFQMIQNWGGDYDGAKISFSMECGFMHQSDLPMGG